MTTFLRLLADKDKSNCLSAACAALRNGGADSRLFVVIPKSFRQVPRAPFAYWVSENVRSSFSRMPSLEDGVSGRVAKRGVNSNDDFRFIRCYWEVREVAGRWFNHPKGGTFAKHYADPHLVLDWYQSGAYLEAERKTNRVYAFAIVPSKELYFRPGLTYSLRTQRGLGMRALPSGCIFGSKGPGVFVPCDDIDTLLSLLTVSTSSAFGLLVDLQTSFGSYEVGVIQRAPMPELSDLQKSKLATLARRAWSLKRTLDTTTETSHAFLLPTALRARLGDYDPPAIEAELTRIQAEIDNIAFDLYGFSDADRAAALGGSGSEASDSDEADAADAADGDEDESIDNSPSADALLSWAIGVAISRFDWRLATGERAAPPEPGPFDPLPAKSPGMLPDGDPPFHAHPGTLVDDPGHPHDLVRITERVLEHVDMPVPGGLRRWLQRDFFPFHLQRYSKSRRKAPVYWPLATESGSYTLWLYYPSLTRQTLYTAVNDFVEPKLKQVSDEAGQLRARGSDRSRADEKRLEALESLETELRDLRDQLLAIAPRYQPNHDDGVQITAAPLWPLFRHKPWQKVLRDTWAKLEKGDYDWAHLAMAYWPERVREKCKTDKSLAIAHGLEQLYVEPEPRTEKTRGRGAKGAG